MTLLWRSADAWDRDNHNHMSSTPFSKRRPAPSNRQSSQLVVSLDAPSAAHPLARAWLGGKGASLAVLRQARLPVPPGFVITTGSWRLHVDQLIGGVRDGAALRQAILARPIPAALVERAREAFDELIGDNPDMPLAVRSSTTEEDGQSLSFAGQQDSYLGIVGFDAMMMHVRRVWASLFNPEALLYRSEASLEATPPEMAVVVQRLVPARSAGVCFTINPISGAQREMVISSALGLGETVVSGGEADTFYIDRRDGRILRQELTTKAQQVVLGDQGTVRADVDEREAQAPSLNSADITRVVQIAGQIESLQQAPQDIEWAFDEAGGLWVLQARPVTSSKSNTQERARGTSSWTNANVGEALPGVGTPMTWSIIRSFSRRGFETAFGALGLDVPESYELVGSFHGRVYLNITQFASVISQIPWMRPEKILHLAGGPDLDSIQGGYERQSKRGFLMRLPLTMARTLGSQLTMPVVGRWWANWFRTRRDAFFRQKMSRLSSGALLDKVDEVDRLFDRTGLVMIASSSNFLSSYVVTRELLKRWGGQEAAARERQLFTGLTGMRSAQPGLEMLRMAHLIRRHPELEAAITQTPTKTLVADLGVLDGVSGAALLRGLLDDFMREYGHRAPREAEIATPRWRENPTFVLDTIKTYLSAPFMPSPEVLSSELQTSRRETTEAIRRHFTTGLGVVFRQFLSLSQHNARLREDLRACVVDTLAMYRHVFLEVGRRLVQRGVLADAEDVFFLTQAEARAFLQGEPHQDYALRVIARRIAYEAFQAAPDPPDTFMLVDGVVVTAEPAPVEGRDTLQGLPGSSGRVTGSARVILDPTDPDSQLRPGEILVAPLTDVGWTPLFLAASGVVMDKGGPLSHSCIVAREYGLPAVVNVKRATAMIKTGDTITIDGDKGLVYLPKH